MRENTKKNLPSSFFGGWHLSISPQFLPFFTLTISHLPLSRIILLYGIICTSTQVSLLSKIPLSSPLPWITPFLPSSQFTPFSPWRSKHFPFSPSQNINFLISPLLWIHPNHSLFHPSVPFRVKIEIPEFSKILELHCSHKTKTDKSEQVIRQAVIKAIHHSSLYDPKYSIHCQTSNRANANRK